MRKYNPVEIEKKWQDFWDSNKSFKTVIDRQKSKYYILDMFPYPSGSGLHVGHPEGYTASDIISRYKRMLGYNVLHPMGWDAFGLPAENYAIKTGTHPKITTEKNISVFKNQIKSLGFSYDWDREVNTSDPKYFKWTQWIFLKLYKKGLAYESLMPINFCPSCKTGLANEEVNEGKCDRCACITERRLIRQWVLRITEYAERLLNDLDLVDWPEPIKIMQKNWIGKSEGAEVEFMIKNSETNVTVFTTRPDTLFGATYFVLSPEHPLVDKITTSERREKVEEYIKSISSKSDLERTELNKNKTGVFTGAYVINPVNNESIPVWIADYVLMSYGTGAIMAVPAHDERDFEFAKKYSLDIKYVICPPAGSVQLSKDLKKWRSFEVETVIDKSNHKWLTKWLIKGGKPYTGPGYLMNSDFLDAHHYEDAKDKITEWLKQRNIGKRKTNYKLRDWIFSRQRYWGEPIPLVHCGKCGVQSIPESELPLCLPEIEKFEPTGTGESPLANIDDWVNTSCPKCHGSAKRETNTMPQWAGSCWYYLRYTDSYNNESAWSKNSEEYFLGEKGVDLYIGGTEHAVLHLLYARFWHKVLYDLKLVTQKEPFYKLKNQGMILGEDNEKMSKSRGNVINPTDVINKFGADSLRLYEMFMGPFEAVKPWSTKGIQGVYRFLQKVWKLYHMKKIEIFEMDQISKHLINSTIKKVTEDIEDFKFNTAISQMMVCVNELLQYDMFPEQIAQDLLKILHPFAPHITEELWSTILDKDTSLCLEKWPSHDSEFAESDSAEYIVQINGKLRAKFLAKTDISREEGLKIARSLDIIKRYLSKGTVIREIYVPKKLVNFVVKE